MIRRLIRWRLAAEERKLGVSVDYLRHILDTSLGAFLKFAKVMPLATYRRALPPEPYWVGRIVSTLDEDCGTCVQIEVNLARSDGVAPGILRAVVDAQPERLPEALGDVYRFARAVVESTGEEDELREGIRRRFGEAGLVELSLAMAVCRIFPVTKRALGYATRCSQVRVEVRP